MGFAGRTPDPPAPKSESDDAKTDLARRLLRKAATETDEDLMETIIRLMRASARNVEIDFDAGPETQALQKSITEKLDEAITAAAMQRSPRRRKPSSASSDKRRMPKGAKKNGQRKQGAASKDSESRRAGEAGERGAAETADPLRGRLLDVRRGWGELPARERDEVIQGIGEKSLERYRVWIERYYRTLQELDE